MASTRTIAALIAAESSSAPENAPRAAASSSAPRGSGSRSATATAPPSVFRATSTTSGGTPFGIVSVIRLRYTAVPILPRIAMPSSPPNSDAVSEIAAAAPAR